MSRILQMAAVLALAAANLPTRDEERHKPSTAAGDEPRRVLPEDPEVARVVRELRERRKQNFLKQRKS